MAKYTTEVSTLLVSKLMLLDRFKKLDPQSQKQYIPSSLTRPYNPVEIIEEFGVEIFDLYFPNVTANTLMTKSALWSAYAVDFKKQFWYDFWSKEIAQENPLDWQRLVYGRFRKTLPMLMLKMEQLLNKDQAFISAVSNVTQSQSGSSDSTSKNNSASFSNNNNLNATATTPQSELDFAIEVKNNYSLDNASTITPDAETKINTTLDGQDQPISGYNFNYADSVSGAASNTHDTAAGSSHTTDTNTQSVSNNTTARNQSIFEIILKMDEFVDGVFLNYFDELKRDSLFIGLTN